MEATESPTLAVEPTADLSAGAEESAATPQPTESDWMNSYIRSVGNAGSLTSNQSTEGQDESDDSDPAGEAAASADVTAAGEAGAGDKPLGRRGSKAAEAAKALADAKAEADDLRAQLAERDPEKIREQIRQQDAADREQQAISAQAASDAERYRRLIATPDQQLSAEDYTWREERKELLAKYPDVQQHYDGVIQSERAAIKTEQQSMQQAFWADVYRQLEPTLTLPGLDDAAKAALKQAPWPEQIRIHRAAERATVDAEMAALRKENDEYKRNALGSVRVPNPPTMPAGAGGMMNENEAMNSMFRGLAAGIVPSN